MYKYWHRPAMNARKMQKYGPYSELGSAVAEFVMACVKDIVQLVVGVQNTQTVESCATRHHSWKLMDLYHNVCEQENQVSVSSRKYLVY